MAWNSVRVAAVAGDGGWRFFVPKDCRGKQATAEGRVETQRLSEREARHYAAESIGGDPAAIRGPQEVVGFPQRA